MHDPSPTAGTHASAVTTDPEWPPSLGDRWAAAASESLERTRLIEQARRTDAAAQLRRCCPSAARVLEDLSWRALTRLAANEPVDPNDPDSWRSPDAHAQIVLRRHGITGLDSTRLTMDAVRALIDGQARADRDAGLDWTRLDVPAARLDAALRRAHARLPIALDDPAIYAYRDDQRRVLAARLGVAGEQAGDLSRWLLAPRRRLRPRRPALLADRVGDMAGARRRTAAPGGARSSGRSGCSSHPLSAVRVGSSRRCCRSTRSGSCIRSAAASSTTCAPRCSRSAPPATCSNASTRARCTPGPNEQLDSAAGLAQALTRELGTPVSAGVAREKYERWGRLLVRRRPCIGRDGSASSELVLRVLTIAGREFPRRRVGAAPRDEHAAQPSAVMELGEAVQAAIERELPLLLSSEAAGQLRDSVRVGRMKGRPGALAFTTADGVSASTRRVVAEQAVPELRALRDAGAKVTLDAGARQLVRMTLARPLDRRPDPARAPEADRRPESGRLGRRRQPGRDRQDDHHRPRARAPRQHHATASARS